MRVSLAALTAAGLGALVPANAQAPTRINDIRLNREGDTVSILVKLSQQPTAAAARASDDDLVVEIDGVDLARLALDPPQGSLVRRVEAAGHTLSLSGAAFETVSTVIYRNAVLVEAKLADPKPSGSSLLSSSLPAPAKPPATPSSAPTVTEPPPSTPADDRPIELVKRSAAAPAPVAPQAPTPVKLASSAAALANISRARCSAAAAEVQKDSWAIPALGDHALCLIDEGMSKEAASRLDQLAAFAPEDWRVALGRAALAAEAGDASNAEIAYRTAASLAPSEPIRAAISAKLKASHPGTP